MTASRRSFAVWLFAVCFASALFVACSVGAEEPAAGGARPNVLFAISDDQSFDHTSLGGSTAVKTPAFEAVAKRGMLFRQGFCLSPGCAPSRAGLLTGRYPWELREAGTHASSFAGDLVVFPDLLENSGYFVGMTGKGWGPGNWQISGRERNPAGPGWNQKTLAQRIPGESANDYSGNFEAFLSEKPEGTPFLFWFGAAEPHRDYDEQAYERRDVDPRQVAVPPFLPDAPEVRTDLANYLAEIERFDQELGRMLELLAERGELDRTLVIVTSDNGMPFPGAKANCYDYGFHVPLAISWPQAMPDAKGALRETEVVTSHIDLAPTILDAAGVEVPAAMRGKSLLPTLRAGRDDRDPKQAYAFASRERHSSSRYENWGYPMRAIRGERYLLARNDHPERWPAGDPTQLVSLGKLGPEHGAYTDIDSGPTKRFMIEHREDPEVRDLFQASFGRRPKWELFDIAADPGCLVNRFDDPALAEVRSELVGKLEQTLAATGDPRSGEPGAIDAERGEVFETYPRYSPIRSFPTPEESASPKR
ncbi:MAG TPA: sulfatase [Pirellulaceae bacterium]|jgi:uncharacterized sulfatase|nr:sulfatase [Pirellulaceae bacterium]